MFIRPVLLLILLFCGVSKVQAHSNDCMEIFAGKPSKTISFDMTPHRIFEIHEDKSSFKMQFYFSFDYPVEKKLPNQMFFCDGVPESFGARAELEKVFNPRFEFMNARNLERLEGYKIYIENGKNETRVSVQTKYEAEFYGNFDFQAFPFDKNKFPIEVMMYYPRNEVEFKNYEMDIDNLNLEAHKWAIGDSDQKLSAESWDELTYEKVSFSLQLERNGTSLTVRYLLPLFFITLFAVVSLALPLRQLESRITVQSGSLIAVLALVIVHDSKFPNLAYLTFVDGILFVSLGLIFLTFIISVTQFRSSKAKKQRLYLFTKSNSENAN